MSTKIATAVLHCDLNEPQKIIDLGIKIRDHLYTSVLFTTPPIPALAFTTQLDKAVTAQGNAPGGGAAATATRNTEVRKLFTLIQPTLLNYVNSLYRGNKTNLLASGFDVVDADQPHQIPDTPAIARIENGPTNHSAKIFLAHGSEPIEKLKAPDTYIVQSSPDGNEQNFHTILTTHNQHKLVVEGLTRGQEVFFRVAGNNSKGSSGFSDPVAFIPQ